MSSTRIEVIDRECVVALPLHLPPVFVPHVTLIAFIALAWTGDGIFEFVRWIIS